MSRVWRNDKPFVLAGTVSNVDRPKAIKPIAMSINVEMYCSYLKSIIISIWTQCSMAVAIAMDQDFVAYENASDVWTWPTQSMLIDANTKKIIMP